MLKNAVLLTTALLILAFASCKKKEYSAWVSIISPPNNSVFKYGDTIQFSVLYGDDGLYQGDSFYIWSQSRRNKFYVASFKIDGNGLYSAYMPINNILATCDTLVLDLQAKAIMPNIAGGSYYRYIICP